MERKSPPPVHRGRQQSRYWHDVANELRNDPHTASCSDSPCPHWGMVGNFSVGVANHIRKGHYPAFLPSSLDGDREAYMNVYWEVTTRKTDDGRNDIYVRALA